MEEPTGQKRNNSYAFKNLSLALLTLATDEGDQKHRWESAKDYISIALGFIEPGCVEQGWLDSLEQEIKAPFEPEILHRGAHQLFDVMMAIHDPRA